MSARVLASGQWSEEDVTMTTAAVEAPQWTVGQIVDVAPRTWIGINRPGGTGIITRIHYASNGVTVDSLDVKYTVNSGHDNNLDPDLVKPHQELAARGRRRTKPEKIAIGTENPHQKDDPMRRARSKGTKVAAKKKSTPSPKKKTPKKKPKKARKVLQQLVHAAVSSPSVVSKPERPDVPIREIVFDSLGTPSSRTSASASYAFFSPLGEEGVETEPSSSASYSNMMCNTEKACVGPSCAPDSDNEAMDCDDDDDPLVPSSMLESPNVNSNVNSRTLASGCFTDEKDKKPAAVRSSDDDDNEEESARVHLSLREVFDDNYKKANRFIGDVVVGRAKTEDSDSIASANESMINNNKTDAQRLDQFRSLLNDMLLNCDGMISDTSVGEQLQSHASASGDTFDFTDAEVDDFLSQLCEQNKIMRTEGMIYNI